MWNYVPQNTKHAIFIHVHLSKLLLLKWALTRTYVLQESRAQEVEPICMESQNRKTSSAK